ncbi:MAG: hypothetical protein IJ004_04485 [Clostridia bacterium]|nr:hypothetical protein [Clostridia bacterium]
MKLKRIALLICALLLVVCVFASCGGGDNTPPVDTGTGSGTQTGTGTGNVTPPEDTTIIYTITIVDAKGNPVKDVNLQICDGGSCLKPKVTDADGKAVYSFNTKLGEPGVQINEAPEGFKIPSGYTYFETDSVSITITLEQVATYTVNAPCGAVVELFNQADESCAKATVDETGVVTFEIAPDNYYAVLTHINGAFTLSNPTSAERENVIVFGEEKTITAEYDVSDGDITYTVTIKDTDGNGISTLVNIYDATYAIIETTGSDESGVVTFSKPNGKYYVVAEVEATKSATVVFFEANGADEGEILVTNSPAGSMKSNAVFIPGEIVKTIGAKDSVWFYVSDPAGLELVVLDGHGCTITIDGETQDSANPITLGESGKIYVKVSNTTSDDIVFVAELSK